MNAQSPYAATKIASDQLALSYFRSFEVPVVVVRPFNTYGPRQSTRAVIPTVISQALSKKSSIELGSLTPTRDFVFVSDTADGFIAAANADERALGQSIQLATGFEISIEDLVKEVSSLTGFEITPIQKDERIRPKKSEVERLCGSPDKAVELLNWRASHHGIEGFQKGLQTTINWFSNPNNLARYKTHRYTV